MRESLVGSPLPGEGFRKFARRGPENANKLGRLDQASHRCGHRLWVVRRNEKPCLSIDYRFTDARGIRRDHRRAARGGLEVADAPPFLGRRQDRGPSAAQQVNFVVLRNEAKKAHFWCYVE